MELQEFYEFMEQHRGNMVESAVKRYHSLGPLLGKVEELVAGTNTGAYDACVPGCREHWSLGHGSAVGSNRILCWYTVSCIAVMQPCLAPCVVAVCRQSTSAGRLLQVLGASCVQCAGTHGTESPGEAAQHAGRSSTKTTLQSRRVVRDNT